jgi:hypothetical protein
MQHEVGYYHSSQGLCIFLILQLLLNVHMNSPPLWFVVFELGRKFRN